MKQRFLIPMLLLLSIIAPFAVSADSFKINPAVLERGETAILTFTLENTQNLYGFQADVTLPAGVTPGAITLASDRAAVAGEYQVTSNVSNGVLKMAAFSGNKTAFSGTSGVLVNLAVTVGDDYAGGTAEVKNIKFTNSENQDVAFDATSATLDVAVAGIALSNPTLTLSVGDTPTLTVTYTPANAVGQTVTWTSNDKSVATVSSTGTVTAVKAGSATITATSANGKTATCEVTVATNIVPVTGITISKTELNLAKGGTQTLSATVTPADATNQEITWSSSDSAVASVSSTGEVTAINGGTATITATSSNGIQATCKVTVTVAVTGVSLNKETLSLTEDGTFTLTPDFAPANATNKTVSWSSSDSEVATVVNGVVTAVKAGIAAITVTTADGNFTATCEVTVAPKPVPVTGVTLNRSTLTLNVGGSSTLKAVVAPENADDTSVSWSSSDTAVATVDENGVVTAVTAGSATITVTTTDGSKTATCEVTVKAPLVNSVPVKMTYVDMDQPDKAFGEIAKGETAEAGYNKISGGSVGFANTSWGVDYITYLQVNVSEITGSVMNATLTFEASGSTDSKRTTSWGVGYNSSAWSADMTYNTADKTITTLGDTKGTTTKSATTFEKFSFDITDAISHAENGKVTILIYETAAAGGYIKNPEVNVKWTDASTYEVTFKETNDVEASVILNNLDVTKGTKLPDGDYTFTATAKGYKDYTGEFTVEGAPVAVEYTMTPKDVWNWTVKNSVNGDVKTGTCFEGESATVAYSRYILDKGTVWMKAPCGGDKKLEYNYTFTPDANNYVETLEYSEYKADGIYFIEAEKMEGMTASTANNANIRCSASAGAYPTEAAPVTVTTLAPGKYKVEIAFMGGKTSDTDPTFFVKAGEKTVLEGTTNGSWTNPVSNEFELTDETVITIQGGNASRPLDYVLITGFASGAALAAYEAVVAEIEAVEEEYNQTVETIKVVVPDFDPSGFGIANMISDAKQDAKDAYDLATENSQAYSYVFNAEEVMASISAMWNASLKEYNQGAYKIVMAEIEALETEYNDAVAEIKKVNPKFNFTEWDEIIGNAISEAQTGALQALDSANLDGVAVVFAFSGEEIENMIAQMKKDAFATSIQAAYEEVTDKIDTVETEYNAAVDQILAIYPDFDFSEWDIEDQINGVKQDAEEAYNSASENGSQFDYEFSDDSVKDLEGMINSMLKEAYSAANQKPYKQTLAEINILLSDYQDAVDEILEINPNFDFTDWEKKIETPLEKAKEEAKKTLNDDNGNFMLFDYIVDADAYEALIAEMKASAGISGIEGIEAEVAAGKAKIFTLDGKSHNAPVKGEVNVIVRGTSVVKTMINK